MDELPSADRIRLRNLEIAGVVFALLAAAGAWIFSSPRIAGGALAGGAIALVNFRMWQVFSRRLLQQENPKRLIVSFQMIGKALFPFLLIAACVWILDVDPIGLSLGLSAVIAAVFGYTALLVIRTYTNKEKD